MSGLAGRIAHHNELTRYQKAALLLVAQIPKGKVTTYGELAKSLGQGNPRSVGQALKKNPFAPECPCHRVLRSDGAIGGYCGSKDGRWLQKKVNLLTGEGVPVEKVKKEWRVSAMTDVIYRLPEDSLACVQAFLDEGEAAAKAAKSEEAKSESGDPGLQAKEESSSTASPREESTAE